MTDIAQGTAAVSGGVQISGADITNGLQWIAGAILLVGGLFGAIVRWMMSQISEERKFSREALEELQTTQQANTTARTAMVSDQRVIADTQREILTQLSNMREDAKGGR